MLLRLPPIYIKIKLSTLHKGLRVLFEIGKPFAHLIDTSCCFLHHPEHLDVQLRTMPNLERNGIERMRSLVEQDALLSLLAREAAKNGEIPLLKQSLDHFSLIALEPSQEITDFLRDRAKMIEGAAQLFPKTVVTRPLSNERWALQGRFLQTPT